MILSSPDRPLGIDGIIPLARDPRNPLHDSHTEFLEFLDVLEDHGFSSLFGLEGTEILILEIVGETENVVGASRFHFTCSSRVRCSGHNNEAC